MRRTTSTRRRVRCTITLMPGREPWLHIEHVAGSFKVPWHATVLDVFDGISAGWQGKPRGRPGDGGSVTISRSEYRELLDAAGR